MADLTHDYENRRARVQEPQYRDALEVLARNRPLTVVERRKAPATYEWLAELSNEDKHGPSGMTFIGFHTGDEGPEMVVCEHTFFSAYISLLQRRDLYQTRAAFMTAMGSLMGIIHGDPADPATQQCVQRWWENEADFCTCSKCGGPLTKAEQLKRDAKLARTQYHAKV